jgi:hypothetical protein
MTLKKIPTTYKVSWHTEPVFMYGVNPALYDTETGFHIYCCDWLRKEKIIGWHHSANEAHKTRQGGILAKRMGQSRGFPDFIFIREKPFAIELKVGKNSLSEHQKEWFNHLMKCRWKCFEVSKFDDFREIVKNGDTKICYSGTGIF